MRTPIPTMMRNDQNTGATGAELVASLTAYVLTYTVMLISYVVVLTHLAGKGSQ